MIYQILNIYIYELLNHEKNDTQIEKQSTEYLRKIYGHE